MPSLDAATLLTVCFVTIFLVGTLFILAWRRMPGAPALGIWGCAHLAGACGSIGLALRDLIPDILSIGLANVLILTAYGLIWSGVQVFEGWPAQLRAACAGAALWGVLCCVPAFYGSIAARIAFASMVAGLYCTASAVAIWRGRRERLASRGPAVALLGCYAACYFIRVPMSLLAPVPADRQALNTYWVTILCLAGMLFAIASAFTFVALIKERAEREQREAARTDPLTGVANRRAFGEGARALIAVRGRATLLLFDLDRFKRINDAHGHAVGDAVLVAFCEAAVAVLPPGVLLGRLGGEEFGCLLPDLAPEAARAIAERLRRVFAAIRVAELPGLTLSVSVGIAGSERGADFETLMQRADTALYAAKAAGRDRVEVAATDFARAA